MQHPGYRWSIARENGKWHWRALDRDRDTVLRQGLADSRAEAAAHLVRVMSLGMLIERDEAAA